MCRGGGSASARAGGLEGFTLKLGACGGSDRGGLGQGGMGPWKGACACLMASGGLGARVGSYRLTFGRDPRWVSSLLCACVVCLDASVSGFLRNTASKRRTRKRLSGITAGITAFHSSAHPLVGIPLFSYCYASYLAEYVSS